MTKLEGRVRVGVDCIKDLGTFYRSCLQSILSASHTIKNSILYVLSGKPPIFVYITKAVGQFLEYWANRDRL